MKVRPTHISFLVATVLATSLTAVATESEGASNLTSITNNGPRIQFIEPYFDFGRLQTDKIVSHDFIFTNTGNAVLQISDVQSSCGCSAVTNWDRQVGPGKGGVLHVLFNTGGMAGPERKNLWVVSNDTNQPSVLLEFTATVWKYIDSIPTIAAFAFGPNGQTNETRDIRLVSNLDEPVTLSAPEYTNQSFSATLETVKPGKEFMLHVSVIPPLGPGSLTVPITMKTSSPKMPVVTVTAYALVQPALSVTPPRIIMKSPLPEAKNYTVTIRNNSDQSVTLSDPHINAVGASVQLKEVQPGKVFDLVIGFPAGFSSSSSKTIEAEVKSNCSQSPILRVPVTFIKPDAT